MSNYSIILTSREFLPSRPPGRGTGAYRIASFLRENNWEVDVIDFALYWQGNQLRQYLEYLIRNKKPKWIGISCTWLVSEPNKIRAIINTVKSIDPTIITILGGQSPFINDLTADYYIFGYAEIALLKILNYEFNSGPPILYKKLFSGKFVNASIDYPANEMSSYKIEYQDEDFITKETPLTIEISRGCKFKCSFCTFPYIGIKNPSTVTEDNLYAELSENYQKWGTTAYFITDETLNDRVEKLVILKNVVNRLSFKPNFASFVRVDLLRSHPEQIELLAEANVWGQFYGVETLNHKTGKAIGKGQNPEFTKETLLTVRDYFYKNIGKYRATINMIAGLPHESIQSVLDTAKWLDDNLNDQAIFWAPLDIPKDGKLSAMGQDLTKFGYREIQEVKKEKSLSKGLMSTRVYWKNDYMDIFEAHELASQLRKNYPLSHFDLWYFLEILGYEKAIKLRRQDLFSTTNLYSNKIITKYINQKISLVKK